MDITKKWFSGDAPVNAAYSTSETAFSVADAELVFTGKLKTKNSETYYVESDDFNYIYDFYSKDVGMIKGNKIYLVYTF